MKLALILLFFIGTFYSAICQTTKIDSLIQQLHNRQIRGECHFVWEIHMTGTAGWELQRMGEKVYPWLVEYLTDTCRGIVVHFIMQAIRSNMNLGIVSHKFDEKTQTHITDLHGLNIYTNQKRPFYFAKPEELEANKKRWVELLNL